MLNTQTTVRYEIKKEMKKQGYNLNSFSLASGINRGVLSATITSPDSKSISVNQLDKMTEALNKPPGWLYGLFIKELFAHSLKPNWRKIRPLLLNCIAIQKYEWVTTIIDSIIHKPEYTDQLFDLAEQLNNHSTSKASLLIYTGLIHRGQSLYPETLSICHYRMFANLIRERIGSNAVAMSRFMPFLNSLPDRHQLDALVLINNVYYTMQDWDKLNQYGLQLADLVNRLYTRALHSRSKTYIPPLQPLVYYYGQAYIAQFTAHEYTQNYEKAYDCISKFSDVSWFQIISEGTEDTIKRLALLAEFNTHCIRLLEGDFSHLQNYMNLIIQHPKEALVAIHMIVKSANLHNRNVDQALNVFHDTIYPDDLVQYITHCTQHNIDGGLTRYINLYYQLAIYHFNQGTYSATLEQILLKLQDLLNEYDYTRILDCLDLLKTLRSIPKMET